MPGQSTQGAPPPVLPLCGRPVRGRLHPLAALLGAARAIAARRRWSHPADVREQPREASHETSLRLVSDNPRPDRPGDVPGAGFYAAGQWGDDDLALCESLPDGEYVTHPGAYCHAEWPAAGLPGHRVVGSWVAQARASRPQALGLRPYLPRAASRRSLALRAAAKRLRRRVERLRSALQALASDLQERLRGFGPAHGAPVSTTQRRAVETAAVLGRLAGLAVAQRGHLHQTREQR